MRFQVFMVVKIQFGVLWVVLLCSLMRGYQFWTKLCPQSSWFTSTIKIKVRGPSQMLEPICRIVCCYNPDDHNSNILNRVSLQCILSLFWLLLQYSTHSTSRKCFFLIFVFYKMPVKSFLLYIATASLYRMGQLYSILLC